MMSPQESGRTVRKTDKVQLFSPNAGDDALVRLSGLTYTFANRPHPALNNVTLTIKPGEFVVLTGPSGCGKSTLALAIGGYLFQQYQGSVRGSLTVAGKDAQQCPVYEMAELVGLVQQNPEAQLCTLTVEDEIAFGLENHCVARQEIETRLDKALQMVRAPHLRHRDLRTLSGGEKQKVAIAAVLVLEPEVLILDEPTSNLDPRATAAIFDVIEDIRAGAGITVIVIEHKLAYLAPFDPRVVIMDKGCVIHDGYGLSLAKHQVTMPRFTQPTGGVPEGSSESEHPLVSVENLTVEFDAPDGAGIVHRHGQGKPTPSTPRAALKHVSFTLGRGEFAVLMGDNGSGKSTLLSSLLGLQKPTQGRVTVLGLDTATTPVSVMAHQVGFVFQNPDHQLFANTVWEEAVIGPRNLGRMAPPVADRVRRLLVHAGLEDRYQDHPYRLSYGEKRRLNLISVLALRPTVLLLDEVLIGQDAQNIEFLLGLLQAAVEEGTTVMMVNHHPEIVERVATRLLFLEEGELIVDAPVAEAMRSLTDLGHSAYLPTPHPNSANGDAVEPDCAVQHCDAHRPQIAVTAAAHPRHGAET